MQYLVAGLLRVVKTEWTSGQMGLNPVGTILTPNKVSCEARLTQAVIASFRPYTQVPVKLFNSTW